MLVGVSIYQMRVHQLKARGAELEAIVEERTRQLEEANRQLSQVNSKLRRLATRDRLTGIANVRLFARFYEREWRRALRYTFPISLIMVDVDFFKLYNDTYGHAAGDECLKQVAGVLRKYANRPSDLAARYGGEEFILILSEIEEEKAAGIAEKVRQDVEALGIVHEASDVCPWVTISVGCVTVTPGKAFKPEMILKEVDAALYCSKQQGRNRVTIRRITRGHAQAC